MANGVNTSAYARECLFLPPFQYFEAKIISSNFVEIDMTANLMMKKLEMTNYGVPSLTIGNGNCLFNAVSIALTENEDLGTELRLRTAIELCTNSSDYQSNADFEKKSPDYDEVVKDCCILYMDYYNSVSGDKT